MDLVTHWEGNMTFRCIAPSGQEVIMDTGIDSGGNDQGPRPKELLLVGLSGCTGMDVVSILEKMKVGPYNFRIEIRHSSSIDHPKIYDSIHVQYFFRFPQDPPTEKIEKAVALSTEKYCSVQAMLRKATVITHEIVYE